MSSATPFVSSATLTIGGNPVDISGSQLAKFSKAALALTLKEEWTSLLSRPVSSLPADETGFQETLSFTPATSWHLPDLPLNLTINIKGSADVAIITSGELLRYMSGLTDPQPAPVMADGSAYVKIKFEVAADGNLSAQANLATTVGIAGSVQAGVDYTITYFKQIPLSDTVEAAIVEAVRSFPLPFHGGTLKQLGAGDYLHYTFAANLALGLGVTYGVRGSLLSGRSVREVQASFQSEIVTSSLAVSPTFTAGVGVNLTYKHNDFFEMLLHRHRDPDSAKTSVHLLRADKNRVGLGVRAAITVDHGANFNITSNLSTVVDQIGAHVTANLQDKAAARNVQDEVRNIFNSAGKDMQNFVTDANQRVNALLQKVNNRGVELQTIIETQNSRVSLFHYIFHLDNGNVDKAWQAAIRGDFVAAYLTPGQPVELEPGSGVEQEFIRRSSVSLNFFGLFQVSSASQFFKNSEMVYAGNGVFNLLYTIGIEWDTATHNSSSAAAISFCAAVSSNLQNVQEPQVTMRFRLTDKARPEAAALSAQLLSDANMPELGAAAAQAMSFARTFRKGTLVVQAELLPSAYARLHASAFSGKTPPPLAQQGDDGNNYSQFVAACLDLMSGDSYGGFPEVCRTFAQWQQYNLFANGNSVPDRRHMGNTAVVPTFWPPSLSGGERALIVVRIEAAQGFMNLCDDLRQLAGVQQQADTPEQFQDVVNTLIFMVKNDADVWFTKPTLLALLLLVSGRAAKVQVDQGTAGGAPQLTVSFQVQ